MRKNDTLQTPDNRRPAAPHIICTSQVKSEERSSNKSIFFWGEGASKIQFFCNVLKYCFSPTFTLGLSRAGLWIWICHLGWLPFSRQFTCPQKPSERPLQTALDKNTTWLLWDPTAGTCTHSSLQRGGTSQTGPTQCLVQEHLVAERGEAARAHFPLWPQPGPAQWERARPLTSQQVSCKAR